MLLKFKFLRMEALKCHVQNKTLRKLGNYQCLYG